MKIDFLDRFIDENNKKSFWSAKKIIGVFFALLFLCLVMVNTTGCTGDTTESSSDEINIDVQPENIPEPDTQSHINVGDDGVKAGLAGDGIKIESENFSNESMVSITLEDTGRADPFMPINEALEQIKKQQQKQTSITKTKISYDLLPPVESLGTASSTIENMVKAKVSGIMYDNYSPSAILNIDGVDYLVRSGDKISDYKVLSISKTVVTVQSGANIYKAGVGQLLTYDNLNNGNIANLEHKFGGTKNKGY